LTAHKQHSLVVSYLQLWPDFTWLLCLSLSLLDIATCLQDLRKTYVDTARQALTGTDVVERSLQGLRDKAGPALVEGEDKVGRGGVG
jgi:hypothetical protein